jgi:hypothetical protein
MVYSVSIRTPHGSGVASLLQELALVFEYLFLAIDNNAARSLLRCSTLSIAHY